MFEPTGCAVPCHFAEYTDWYNHRRLQGELGLVPPADYETTYRAAQTDQHYRKNPVLTEVGTNQPSASTKPGIHGAFGRERERTYGARSRSIQPRSAQAADRLA